MIEALGPFRASFVQIRRRSVILLFLILVGLSGFIAWTSYQPLRQQRRTLSFLGKGDLQPENLPFGISCREGGPPGKPGAPQPIAPTPGGDLPECRFVSDSGEPFGPVFRGDPFGPRGLPKEALDAIRPELVAGQKEAIRRTESLLGWRAVLDLRERSLGTIFGVILAVLFAATFFGAEMRWGVWRTLLTHEPRRGRVLAGKLAAMWTIVLLMFLFALAAGAITDAIMRPVLNVHASGGPSIAHLVKQAGWALLPLELYATISAALALTIRTSLAGIGALGLMLGDHLLVSKYHWLRVLLPTQQVAWLAPQPERLTSGYAWFPRLIAGVTCTEPQPGAPFSECKVTLLKAIPHWRASLVIGAWVAAFALAAWALLRARDVPQ